jgi:hypothetical protein
LIFASLGCVAGVEPGEPRARALDAAPRAVAWESTHQAEDGGYATALRGVPDVDGDGFSDVLVLGEREDQGDAVLELRSGASGEQLSRTAYKGPDSWHTSFVDALARPGGASGRAGILALAVHEGEAPRFDTIVPVEAELVWLELGRAGAIRAIRSIGAMPLESVEHAPLVDAGAAGSGLVALCSPARWSSTVQLFGFPSDAAEEVAAPPAAPVHISAEVVWVGTAPLPGSNSGDVLITVELTSYEPRVVARSLPGAQIAWSRPLERSLRTRSDLGGVSVGSSGRLWLALPGSGCRACPHPRESADPDAGCGRVLELDLGTGAVVAEHRRRGVHRFGLAMDLDRGAEPTTLCAVGLWGAELALLAMEESEAGFSNSWSSAAWPGAALSGLRPVVVRSPHSDSRAEVVLSSTFDGAVRSSKLRCSPLRELRARH